MGRSWVGVWVAYGSAMDWRMGGYGFRMGPLWVPWPIMRYGYGSAVGRIATGRGRVCYRNHRRGPRWPRRGRHAQQLPVASSILRTVSGRLELTLHGPSLRNLLASPQLAARGASPKISCSRPHDGCTLNRADRDVVSIALRPRLGKQEINEAPSSNA